MIEYFIAPAAIAALAMIPKGKGNDRKKIDQIFKNFGYGIRGKDGESKFPKYKGKKKIMNGEEEVGIEYKYSVPLGLPASKMAKAEQDMKLFADGLRKPVVLKFDGYLKVRVYHQELPSLVPYTQLPHTFVDEKGKEQSTYKKWVAPLGTAQDGWVWRDFDAIPHMTIAGTTRFGKTVGLKMILTYLIEHHSDDIDIYIIDLKGGLEFGPYEHHQQIKVVASDTEEAFRLLFYLANTQPYEVIKERGKEPYRNPLPLGRMIHDYKFFRENRITNIVNTKIKKRTFVIVDEGAQLTPENYMEQDERNKLNACQGYLSTLARLGGALGYRLIFATQYPTADTLPRQVKMNSDVKMTFRLSTGYASDVAIDSRGAEELPVDLKGRALYKTHMIEEMQVPYISDGEMWSRLEKYQVPKLKEGDYDNVINAEKATETREDIVEPTPNEVCNTVTITGGTRLEK